MPGKMLTGGRHARFMHTRHKSACERFNLFTIGTKRTIANHLRVPIIEIQYRSERNIDVIVAQLCCHQPAELMRPSHGFTGVVLPSFTEYSHWRQTGEPLFKPLHATALLVDRHQQVWTDLADCGHELSKLCRVLVVTSK